MGSPQRDGALGRARTSLRAGHLRATAWVGRRYRSRIAACNATGTRPPDRYGPAASGSAAPFADDHPHAASRRPRPRRTAASPPARRGCATPPTPGPGSRAGAPVAGSATGPPTARRSATARSCAGSGRWPSRRPGRTSGSAPIRPATSRRPAATRAGGSSTATTPAGGRGRDDAKFERLIDFAEGPAPDPDALRRGPGPARACRARRCWRPSSGCSS